MPALSGTQSPMLQNFFARRDQGPLYVEIPSRDEEKPATPVITLTPSTPTEEKTPVYPHGRLPQPNARYYFCNDSGDALLDLDYDDENDGLFAGEEDRTLKPVSRWPRLLPAVSTRTARISVLLGIIAAIALVHYLATMKMTAPGRDGEDASSTTTTSPH